MQMEAKFIKTIYIYSQGADPSPPLGTVLGNLGVNTSVFCTNFNQFTKNIPNYFLLKVKINIFDNRSTSFSIDLPSTGYILSLLKFDRTIKIRVNDRIQDQIISCVLLKDIVCLAKWKFKNLLLVQSIKLIYASARSKGLVIVNEHL
jgi:large subunit ribosomal protein L11